MKGIIWNCKKVDWKQWEEGERGVADCLLVHICCETGDSQNEAKEAARRILQLNKKRFLRERLVIFPFAHLSDKILDSDKAVILINIVNDIVSKNMKVSIMGFNKNKEVSIHLLPNNGDVSYFSY